MRVELTDRRLTGRYRPNGMSCNLGEVVDLSAEGVRVLSRKALVGEHQLVMLDMQRQPLRLRARVLWHRRHAKGEHVHGLRFERVTFEQRDQLDNLIDALANGKATPTPNTINRFGLAGVTMMAAACVMTITAIVWTFFNTSVQSTAPGVHQALRGVPEFGALLLITAGGCGLLGLTQRLMPTTYTRAGQRSRNRHQNELDRVRRSQNVLNCILESSLGGVAVLEAVRDTHDKLKSLQIQLINPAAEQLIGKSESALVGQTLEEALPRLTEHELYDDLLGIVKDGQTVQKQYQVGEEGKWYLVAMVRLADGIAVTFMDTTESQQHREKLKHIAYHDELTGLPNRKALIEHVDSAITRCRRAPGHRCALLFLDFDRFKHVNDTMGHDAGDQLLISIAERLRTNLRESDAISTHASECMPARLGGDEFVVLIDGITTQADAVTVAQRLLKVFGEPHFVMGQAVTSTASIGIAINEGTYDNADDILRDADAAMYTAKQNGKARYVLFDQDMHNKVIERIRLEQDLTHAVERSELRLAYEPIIDLSTGRAAGFEALLRWQHPQRGDVSPAEFVPLAESINLMGRIGEWVISEGAAQLANWHHQGLTNTFLNINLSRAQLYEPNLVSFFKDQIEGYGLREGALRIELTETMVMNDLEFMADKLGELKALGLGLALDDFGTGYSSLSVLHKLPFDTLKIDRAFLEDARVAMAMDATHRSSAIISAITELADHLKLEVVAEGIIEQEQVATLQKLACRYAQGWLFSEALPAEAATELLLAPSPHAAGIASQLDHSA